MHTSYLVRQDGADFYLMDGSALDAVITYPQGVRGLSLTQAHQAREWFKHLMLRWGITVTFEGEQ